MRGRGGGALHTALREDRLQLVVTWKILRVEAEIGNELNRSTIRRLDVKKMPDLP